MPVIEHLELDGVVVGDDGSRASREAIRWAAEHAQAQGLPLHVVRAWTMSTASRPKDWSPGYVPSMLEFEDACRGSLEEQMQGELASYDGLVWKAHTVHGPPAQKLTEAAASAKLLVVGWRGRSGIRDRLLGSTAEHVIKKATCSIAIIRPSG